MTARACTWMICCDEPTGCDDYFDVEPGTSIGGRSVTEVRVAATDAGWTRINGRDLCPTHTEKER